MEARLCFLTILLSLSLLLLLGVRDHRAVERIERDSVECVAQRYSEGAPHWMAVNLCGGLDPDGLERDLP
jgi:hypothetical protein